jgi:protoheme IX farnesyltransferase
MNSRIATYFELAKPRITLELLIVAIASYAIASGAAWTWWGYVVVAVSVALLGTGIFALNHYLERDKDALMARTKDRPLPSGRVGEGQALVFGSAFTLAGIIFSFAAANLVTGVIAVFTAVSYLAVYTPLKYKTAFHTALGALPGAVGPLAGWSVAQGNLWAPYPWILFGLMFLWQFPHFLAIEMLYRDDYAKADIRVVPVVDRTGVSTAWQILVAQILLLALTVTPLFLGIGTWITAAGNTLFGLVFLVFGIRAARRQEPLPARHLLRVSVFYLPFVFVLLYFHP